MNITCVIASYKYGHLAAHCIESVLSQALRPDEIIVVDDGAGDLGHLREIYAGEKIEWVLRPKNLGTVENFNRILFNHVTTNRVMFLGADNYLRPDAFAHLYPFAQDYDIISYDLNLFGTEVPEFSKLVGATERGYGGTMVWRFKPCDIEERNYIHGSSLYNADLAKAVGGYRASGNANTEEDWMLWRAMLANKARHFHMNVPLMNYRRHKKNFSKWGPDA